MIAGVPAGFALVASTATIDGVGGGVFALGPGGFRQVDQLAGAGMATDGRRLARLLAADDYEGLRPRGRLAVYDEHGCITALDLPHVPDPHDLVAANGRLWAASPWRDAVVAMDWDGRLSREWRMGSALDAWHLNCLRPHAGRLYATAFGRFDTHRAWARDAGGTGILFDVGRRAVVGGGLTQPHDPRWVDGAWLVADSGRHSVVRMDAATGEIVEGVELTGWTRGIAVAHDRIWVGESTVRRSSDGGRLASVAMLDRRTLEVLDRFDVESPEIYGLYLVPTRFLDAIARGESRAGAWAPARPVSEP